MDLLVTDGREGDDRHVDGITPRPPLDDHVPHGADEDDRAEESGRANETGRVTAHGPLRASGVAGARVRFWLGGSPDRDPHGPHGPGSSCRSIPE